MRPTHGDEDHAAGPPSPGLPDLLCFAVYAASHAFGRAYKPLLAPLGLTYPQYLVMLILWEGEAQTVGAIGRRLVLESSTLTPLLKRLEAQGLVARARDSGDERQVLVRLTNEGLGLRERARDVPGRIGAATGLDAPALARLQAELAALRDRLDRASG